MKNINSFVRGAKIVGIGFLAGLFIFALNFSLVVFIITFLCAVSLIYEFFVVAPYVFARSLTITVAGTVVASLFAKLGINGFDIIGAAAIALIYELSVIRGYK